MPATFLFRNFGGRSYCGHDGSFYLSLPLFIYRNIGGRPCWELWELWSWWRCSLKSAPYTRPAATRTNLQQEIQWTRLGENIGNIVDEKKNWKTLMAQVTLCKLSHELIVISSPFPHLHIQTHGDFASSRCSTHRKRQKSTRRRRRRRRRWSTRSESRRPRCWSSS